MNFFGVGTGEILLILVIAVLVVGPDKMVSLARDAGRMVARIRRMTDDVTGEFREAFDFDVREVTEDLKEVADDLKGIERDLKTVKSEVRYAQTSVDQAARESAAVIDEASAKVSKAASTIPAARSARSATKAAPAAQPPAVAPVTEPVDEPAEPAALSPDEEAALRDAEPVEIQVAQLAPEDEDVEPVTLDEVTVVDEDPAPQRPARHEG